jgi:hypothetical protein
VYTDWGMSLTTPPPSTAEVKNEWNNNSTTLHAYMVHIGTNLPFLFYLYCTLWPKYTNENSLQSLQLYILPLSKSLTLLHAFPLSSLFTMSQLTHS